MIAVAFSLSAGLLAGPTQDWVSDLQRRAQPMLIAKTKPLTKRRIDQVFGSLGHPAYRAPVSRVAGGRGRYVVGVGLFSGVTCAFLVEPSGQVSTVRADREADQETDEATSYLVHDSQMNGNTLLLGGLEQWSGNGPRYRFETLERHNDAWVITSGAQTENECWGANYLPLYLVRGGTVEMQSRTYGTYLNCSHATALVSIAERFEVRGGRVRRVGERRMDTPFNRLDDLAGALAKGNAATVRQIVPSAALRRRLPAIWKQCGPGPRIASPNSVNYVDGKTFGWYQDDQKHVAWFHFARRSGRWVVTSYPRD